MTTSHSLQSRALVAVALTIGFYTMAVAIAAGLFFVPYAEWTYGHQLHIKLAFICVFGGLAIIWSVLPHGTGSTAPGPLLSREKAPQLFAELESVAKAVGQELPVEVYLLPEMNAWVSERGSFLGVGGRRIMGLGLPLMRVLNVSEFRAVLAHEFGHYHGGDTKLGPWVYQTHRAIGLTLQNLGGRSWWEFVLRLPFKIYANVFLRVTHAISRQQEFVADALAARMIGAGPMISGLQKIHGKGSAFDAFWGSEYVPLLRRGYRAPLLAGFTAFLKSEDVKSEIKRQLEEQQMDGKANPYDTHPSLAERIGALKQFTIGPTAQEAPDAITLLGDLEPYETELLKSILAGGAKANEELPRLRPVAWSAVAQETELPLWRQFTLANGKALAGQTSEGLPELTKNLSELSRKIVTLGGEKIAPEHAGPASVQLVGAALTTLLCERGAIPERSPGSPLVVRLGHSSLRPFEVFPALAAGSLEEAAWRETCKEFGILGVPLGGVKSEVAVESRVAEVHSM